MEVVQGGGPLVCAPRAPPSSTHPPLRLGHHHRFDADGPASAALHVQTEEGGGGGGLDPSWWRISASGSWDGGERKMRYGKLIDDRPGSIPGAVQRRKLELLETHAPGASMRVVHSQSHASWRQDGSGGDLSSGGMSSSGTASRSLLSTSSSTRVTSYRQWSSNFSQTTSNVAALKQETRPAVTEFGNLELALNPLDVSFLRTRGNVGRSGSIGSRRPPTRSRRLSSGAPSPDSGESNPASPEAKSPQADFGSSGGDSPDDRRREDGKSPEVSGTSPVSESIRDSVSRLIALGWHPPGSGMPPLPPLSPLRTAAFSASTPLHRKRSVSSEDLRSPDGAEGSSPDGDADSDGLVKWERGASVRRSLPSSEWRSVVGPDSGSSRLLRPRDPLKSSSVPALGGPAAANRKGSLVTAESLREMKGRLKHRGSVELVPQQPEGVSQTMVNGVEPARKEDLRSEEGPKVSLRAAKEDFIVQDDRRKSWSVGCRNVEKREVVNGEEDSGFASRRRSYAFEFSDDTKQSPSSPEKKGADWLQLQNGDAREEVGHRIMLKAISSDSSDFVQNRVNEMLKKWSALTGGSCEGELNTRRAASSSPIMRRQEGRWSPAKNSTTTWLDHGDATSRSENGGDAERNGFAGPATTISGARTTLRLTHAKGHSSFEKETVGGTSRPSEKVHPIMDELPPSASGHLVEDYSCPRGLSPVDWSDGDTNGVLPTKEPLNRPDQSTTATSAGISVIFSNTDGGDGHNGTSTRHHSVTHLESKEVDGTRTEGGMKIRASKKVEFSKTEVHFAAESGRFHIVETAGKPPPSNNFRRRRRSPTGSLNVDSSAAGARAMLLGGPSALTNGMRFGDSPYEKRLLAGTDGVADNLPSLESERESVVEVSEEKQLTTNGENHYEYGFTSSRTFQGFETKEEETKNTLEKIQDVDFTSSNVNFRHVISEDTAEKPRGILRSNPAASNSFSWKPLQKLDDDSDDSSKPKFGGVRLRPVISPELHSRISLSSLETSETSRILSTEKALPSPLSPGQMELQKLLKSLRPVSVTPYADSIPESNDELETQVANGGGMEVRITSGNQTAVTNAMIISGEASSEVLTPLSVAQRVREVEERRQRELREKLGGNQKVVTRTPGQFSTRVTLGPVSSSVVSVEPQVFTKKLIPSALSSSPPSPKLAAKISAQSKISRIQTSQDKVGPRQIIRKGIREETCRKKQTCEILAPQQEKAVPKPEADSAPPPFGRRFDAAWRAPLSPLHLEIAPLQPLVTRRLSLSSTSSRVDDMWFKGLLTTAQPVQHHPPPSASWPSARGFGRVGDDRVVLKSPSLILQTMLSTAFPPKDSKETITKEMFTSQIRREGARTMAVDAFRVEEVLVEKKVEKVSKETLMSGDKVQRNLSILRALYRDASEEECSDAYEAAGRMLGGLRMGGESRLGDGGSVVSGSWRRMKRAKQQQSSQKQTTESVPIHTPKPVPRKQSSKTKTKSIEPPRPPPRNHRNDAQARIRRTDAKGRTGVTRERAEERTRRRGGGGLGGGGGDCGGKGDTSGFSSDNLQHDQSDVKASTENRSRSEHYEDSPGIACIALGQQTRTKGVRESKEDFMAKEDPGMGSTPSEVGRCNKIFSALSVSRDNEVIGMKNSKKEGVKLFTAAVEKTPGDLGRSRHREYKSASPSKQMTSSWPGGSVRATKEETKTRSEISSSKDSFKLSRKVKEITTAPTSELQKKSHYSAIRSPPPQTKIFSGLFGGSPVYEKSTKATEVADGMDGGYSVKLKVIEKRLEEVGPQQKTSKSEQPQRRSSLDEKNKKVEVVRSTTVGGTQVPRSPRLTETSRLSQLRQSSTSVTTSTRPASPRLSPVIGDHAGGGSPSTGRAVRKRVRRRASGSSLDGVEDKRRGKKTSTGGDEVSEESAILAELTRAADEILHAVNGYSDDLTSDEEAAKVSGTAARSKRRSTRAQHSKKSSSSSSNAVTTTKEVAKSSSIGAQRSTVTRTRSGGKENSATLTKERSQAKEGASSHEATMKGSGANVKGQSSMANVGSPSSSPQVSSSTRATALSSSFSEKEKGQRSKLQHQGSGSPRTRSAMTRVEPTNRVAEVKLIEKRPPLPPGGQRRGKDGLKESRSEVHTRATHGKTKSAASTNLLNGESEVTKSETKRTINIARALEAVMPDPRNKTRKVEKKTDEHLRKESSVLRPASPQSSPGISLSLERKKVASSREGDKTSRRGIPA